MNVRRTLRSLGVGGWTGFGEFRKDTSELCSEELHFGEVARIERSDIRDDYFLDSVLLYRGYNRNGLNDLNRLNI